MKGPRHRVEVVVGGKLHHVGDAATAREATVLMGRAFGRMIRDGDRVLHTFAYNGEFQDLRVYRYDGATGRTSRYHGHYHGRGGGR